MTEKKSAARGERTADQLLTEQYDQPTAAGRQIVCDLHRRRAASYRKVVLPCGCRDPWPCHHHDAPASEKMTTAAVEAAAHLEDRGLTPLFDLATLRELWRLGHRGLAERLARHE